VAEPASRPFAAASTDSATAREAADTDADVFRKVWRRRTSTWGDTYDATS